MTRPLTEQLQNLKSAQIALVEVSGRLPAVALVYVRVDAVLPQIEVQLLRMTHDQAVEVATELGIMQDAEGNPRDVRRSRFAGADIVHTWAGTVADFPVLLSRVERGAARQPAARQNGPAYIEPEIAPGPPSPGLASSSAARRSAQIARRAAGGDQ